MRATTALRIAVLGEFVLVISAITLSELFENSLPAELQAWRDREPSGSFTPIDVVVLLGLLAAVAAVITSWVGLLFLKKWAAWTYLAANVGGHFSSALSADPHVAVPIAGVFDDLAVVASGVVLGVVFFSDALKPPKRTEAPPEPPVLFSDAQRHLEGIETSPMPPVLPGAGPTTLPTGETPSMPPLLTSMAEGDPPIPPATRGT